MKNFLLELNLVLDNLGCRKFWCIIPCSWTIFDQFYKDSWLSDKLNEIILSYFSVEWIDDFEAKKAFFQLLQLIFHIGRV